jgi:hypothetical protein
MICLYILFDFQYVLGNINTAFKINQDLGDITVNQELDREMTPEYLLTVVATDHGNPTQHSTTQVKVWKAVMK